MLILDGGTASSFRGVTAHTTYLRESHEPDAQGNFDNGDWDVDHRVWDVRLRLDGREMAVTYRTGLALDNTPTAADVLETLIQDSNGYDNADGFEDWADNYGYDTDSRRAERLYRAVESQRNDLAFLLADRYDEFLALEF